MKKIYNSPTMEIAYIKSESVITISGFRTIDKGGNLKFDNSSYNGINF